MCQLVLSAAWNHVIRDWRFWENCAVERTLILTSNLKITPGCPRNYSGKYAQSTGRTYSLVSTSALAKEHKEKGKSLGGSGQSLQRTFQEVESGSNQRIFFIHGEECSEILELLWTSVCCVPLFSFLNGSVYFYFPVPCSIIKYWYVGEDN